MTTPPLATVGALVVSPDDSILLIQTHKWRNLWGVPGGKIDYGEPIKDALLREFQEETGLNLDTIHWGPVQESIEADEFYKPAHFILLNFIAKCQTKTVRLNEEAQRYEWLQPNEAMRYDLNKPTRALLEFYLKNGFSGPRL